MPKIAIVSFKGEMSCFVHALLNLENYHQKGYETKLVVEGASTARISDIGSSPNANLWEKIKQAGLVYSVCKACSVQMGSLEEAQKQDLPIDASLSGHSDLEPLTKEGYEIILF